MHTTGLFTLTMNSMNPDKQIKTLAELDGFKYVKIIGEPDPTHWQMSKAHEHDGCLSAGTPWQVNFIVRDKPDDDDSVINLKLVPPYLISYDAIIPLIQKQSREIQWSIHESLTDEMHTRPALLNATPAQLCEALLRAHNLWEE